MQLVELALAGRGLKQLSREFGVSANTIRNWLVQARADAGGGVLARATVTDAPLSRSERDELQELRRKLRQVQQERDILANSSRAAARPLAKKHAAPKISQRADQRPLAFWRLSNP